MGSVCEIFNDGLPVVRCGRRRFSTVVLLKAPGEVRPYFLSGKVGSLIATPRAAQLAARIIVTQETKESLGGTTRPHFPPVSTPELPAFRLQPRTSHTRYHSRLPDNMPNMNPEIDINPHTGTGRTGNVNVMNSYNTICVDEKPQVLKWPSPLEPRARHQDLGLAG